MLKKQTALKQRIRWGFSTLIVLSILVTYLHRHGTHSTQNLAVGFAENLIPSSNQISKEHVTRELKRAFTQTGSDHFLPSELELPIHGKPTKCILQYSINSKLQVEMESLFDTYRPDFGAFVAIDPDTGKVLSLVSYAQKEKEFANFALKGDLPSASVFKMVTAAAAIGNGKLSPESIISFNGMNHTLYRRNVFDPRINRWTRHMTMREAFAKSVNTVFARIGTLFVGPQELRAAASSFGFNRQIASDLPIEEGHAAITNDSWQVAEAASGYTKENTMSPLQGALMAAAVANNGTMMEPYIVEAVLSETGNSLYSAHPQIAGVAMNPATAEQLRRLMQETVTHGTARGAFKRFFRQIGNESVEVGGKTGSLSGTSPGGKYDWFIGYAKHNGQRIAFAALTINKKFWKVKSAYLARKAIESYFAGESRVTLVSHPGIHRF